MSLLNQLTRLLGRLSSSFDACYGGEKMKEVTPYLAPSKFVEEPHLHLRLGDIDLLDRLRDTRLDGLVCALDGCFADPKDQEEVSKCFRLKQSGRLLAPLYVCPDCLDLDCTVLSVWLEFGPDEVVWSGFALGEECLSEGLTPIRFSRGAYEVFLGECQRLGSSWWGEA